MLAQKRAQFVKLASEAERYLSACEADPANLNRAYARYVKSAAYVAEQASQKDFDDLTKVILEAADDQFRAAVSLLDNADYNSAIKSFESLALLRKLDVGANATSKLREIRQDPELRAAMRERDASDDMTPVDDLLDSVGEPHFLMGYAELTRDEWGEIAVHDADRAAKLMLEDRVGIVGVLRDIVDRFEETCCGERAAALLHEMNKDTALVEAVEHAALEARLARDFNLARNYAMNGNHAEARILYEGMLAEDPGEAWRLRIKTEIARLR